MSFESEDKIKYELHNCPFCWSADLTMDREIAELLETGYQVKCVKCGAYGPNENDVYQAAKNWNQSPDPLKQHMPWKIAFIITTFILVAYFVLFFSMLFFNKYLFFRIYEYKDVSAIAWFILLICDIIIWSKWTDSKDPPKNLREFF
jgi:Lar family restriction alleviation protein